MQNIEIISIVNAYQAQKEKGEGVKLPAAVAWKRRLNLDRLFRAKAVIDEALREVQARYSDDEHSEPGEEGTRRVGTAFQADFFKEQGDILTQDTPVEISKVKIDDIGDVTLTDADMDTLAFMIEAE